MAKAAGAIAFWGLAALLLVCMGCLPPKQDPGPDPARVDLTVLGSVSQAAVQNALNKRGGITAGRVRFKNHYGPWWELTAEVLGADGKAYSLRTVPGEGLPDLVGREVTGKTAFLLLPGENLLRLTFCAKVRQYWDEVLEPAGPRIVNGQVVGEKQTRWRSRQQEVVVDCLKREIAINLGPGQGKAVEIRADFN